jgi:hypothetical protein
MSSQTPTFGIAQRGLGSNALIPLSEAEYLELVAAKALVFEIISLEEKWDVVVTNHLDLEKTLNDIAAEHMVQGAIDYHPMSDKRLTINRRVMNSLATCRLYLDHAPQHLGRLESHVSNLVQTFGTQTNMHFAESQAYRIADMMRNHAQHFGLPIETIRLDITNSERADSRDVLLYRIEAHLDLEAFIANPANRAATRDELKKLNSPPSVRTVLREYLARLSLIHQTMRNMLESVTIAKEALLSAAIRQFEERYAGFADFPLSIVEFGEQGTWKADTTIFKKFLERRKHLSERNRALPQLIRAHVTTEPDSR